MNPLNKIIKAQTKSGAITEYRVVESYEDGQYYYRLVNTTSWILISSLVRVQCDLTNAVGYLSFKLEELEEVKVID